MTARVFMPQRPVTRVDGEWRDKYDLTSAKRFGRLVEVVPAGSIPRDLGVMMRMMEAALGGYSLEDFLLAIGDPLAIAMAVLVAGKSTGGTINLLKFDRLTGEYKAHSVSTG